jgi:hypothetical protein
MVAAPRPLIEETTAVSEFAPSSIVIVWPLLKPVTLAAGRIVAPASVEVRSVVAPAVPTVAMTAVSVFAPESIWTVWPVRKPSVLATLMFVAPAADVADKEAADCVKKSEQLLSVSAPSGNRPALVLMATGATTVDQGMNTEPGAGA